MTDTERLNFLEAHPSAVEWSYGWKCWLWCKRLMSQRAESLRGAIDNAAAEWREIQQRNGSL